MIARFLTVIDIVAMLQHAAPTRSMRWQVTDVHTNVSLLVAVTGSRATQTAASVTHPLANSHRHPAVNSTVVTFNYTISDGFKV